MFLYFAELGCWTILRQSKIGHHCFASFFIPQFNFMMWYPTVPMVEFSVEFSVTRMCHNLRHLETERLRNSAKQKQNDPL